MLRGTLMAPERVLWLQSHHCHSKRLHVLPVDGPQSTWRSADPGPTCERRELGAWGGGDPPGYYVANTALSVSLPVSGAAGWL